MTVVTPQFDAPFRLNPDGTPALVEQDSPQDVGACIYNISVCLQGEKLGDPNFGVPSLLFQTVPLQTQTKIAAIRRLEPRASTLSIDDIASFTQGPSVRNMTTSATVPGSPTEQSS